MKRLVLTFALLATCAVSSLVHARDDAKRLPIAQPMQTNTAAEFTSVRFFFGDQAHPAVQRTIGTYTTRRNTNAFNKSDQEACDWGFLSAVKTLWERALAEGGNAVINIRSVTTGDPLSSSTEYVCRAGNVVAKVYLEGTVVVID
jgi:UDP-3-O-acyl-N-acetylglucosamine deacetylase